jgi:hypothetical protein
MRPNTSLAAAIVRALAAGNGRSNRVTEDELIQRLVEDGVKFAPAELFTALGKLISEGRVARRTGLGLWLNSGCNEVYGNEPEEPLTRRDQRLRWGPGWLG